MILGYPWLRNHNPEVNWQTQEVTLSRCPSQCHTCQAKAREEWREAAQIHACCMWPLPQMVEEEEGEEEEPESVNFGPLLDPGEHLFATVSTPTVPTKVIAASTTTAQQLAEKALRSVPAKEKELIPPYLRDFDDVFAKESFNSLPEQRMWDHAIELEPGVKPSASKVYPLAPSEQLQLDEFLRENLRTGRIRPSKSPMASPVFFIKKKDGSLRLVQDYRMLNAMTVKNRYPLPIISELIAQLQGAKYFTKLNVRWGFNNVQITEGDKWKAAFCTNRGLYEPLVMFFGLTNIPEMFQTMMNDIFQDLIMEGHVCMYMDDILIFTKTLAEH
jgi:Reverse transcriptase (RNA-dependent DNA polymerase)